MEIKQNGTNPSMFGGEENNWITSGTIYTAPYQGIDRLNDRLDRLVCRLRYTYMVRLI